MKYQKILFLLMLIASGYSLVVSPTYALTILGQQIDCDPALPPAHGGCGIPHFIKLVQIVIGFLQTIIIPIAVIFIVYGGFVIMTAGSSEDKLKTGKKIITAAIIGIVIALAAYLLVTALNFIIAPEFQFK